MNSNQDAEVAISGTFEYRDAEGNLLKEVPFTAQLPINPQLTSQLEDGYNGMDL